MNRRRQQPQGIPDRLVHASCAAFDASYYQLWTFSGTAGDVVTVDMESTSFDAFLGRGGRVEMTRGADRMTPLENVKSASGNLSS
jgi:hypothetical protein